MHVMITGLVQGVGFRYFVLRRAQAFGVTGWARNLFTGEVEVVAQGDKASLEHLLREVRIGPRSAQVTDVKVAWDDTEERFNSFEIR